MHIKISLIVLLSFSILANCSSSIQETASPISTTQSVEIASPFPKATLTPTLPQSETFELTVSMRDENSHSYVYVVEIGCLDTKPCLMSSELLFDKDSYVRELSWSPDGHLLAFDCIVDGGSDIFVATADGSVITNITKTQELDESSPSWSPDSMNIAYSVSSGMADSKIFVSSPNGTDTKQILSDVFEPIEFIWSQQGKTEYSAFASTSDGRYQIRVLNEDGSLYWLIPLNDPRTGFSAADAAFSPDGNRLVYTGSTQEDRIYVADLQTKSVQELFPSEKICSDFKPSWSPNGQWLAFLSNCESEDDHRYDLYLTSSTRPQKIKLDTGINGHIQDVVWRPGKK